MASYKIEDLTAAVKNRVLIEEVIRFNTYFLINDTEITNNAKLDALRRIEAYGFRFTKNGKKLD